MDADTRHQLKQNELAEALGKLVDFSDKRTLGWLVAIVVVAVGWGGYRLWNWQRQASLIAAQQTLGEINAIDASMGEAPLTQLRQLIAENSQPGLVALARLKLAEGLQERAEGGDQTAKLAEAEAEYHAILNMPNAPAATRAPALYRLGIIGEDKRDFAQAREMYTTLSGDPAYAGSPLVAVAEDRLEQFDELAVPVVFKPGLNPNPTPEPTTAPTKRREMKPVKITEAPGRQLPVEIPTAERPPQQEQSPAPATPEPDKQETPAEETSEEPATAETGEEPAAKPTEPDPTEPEPTEPEQP